MIDWKTLETYSGLYQTGKKCGSGSLLDFANKIKEAYDKMTEEEKTEWRFKSRWGAETFDNCESILREQKLIN